MADLETAGHETVPADAFIDVARSKRNRAPYVIARLDGLVSEAGLIARDKLSLPVSPARSVFKRGGSCGRPPPQTGLGRQFRSIWSRGVPMSAKHPAAHYGRSGAANSPPPVRFNYALLTFEPSFRLRLACLDTRPSPP